MDILQAPLRPADRRFRFFRSVMALVLREMSSTYGRSPGGYLWLVLEPVAALTLLSFVFSIVLRSPSLGSNFMLFYATGYLPFAIYMSVSSKLAASIRYSRQLLEYPAVTFADALIARLVLDILTHLLVFSLVVMGIIQIFDLNPILNWSAIFTSLAMIVGIAISIGVMNCFLMTGFPLWERVWAILTRPLFIISGILFIPEDVPAQYRDWMMMNPLAHGVSEMRNGFYGTYDAVHVDPIYVFSLALGVGVFGLLFLLKNHKDIALK
ncbi:MAG: ABC transporter permease [Sulfitobacter sp.]